MSIKLGIAVDALSPNLTGIGLYCRELVWRLPSQPEIESLSLWRGNDRIRDAEALLAGRKPVLDTSIKVRNWLLRRAKKAGLVADSAMWPRRHGVALFHGPNFMLPAWVEGGIITVHDLSVFLFPETHPAARIRSFERDFAVSLNRARHIITPSQTVKRELVQFAGLDEAMISAVPMGVGEAFAPVGDHDLRHSLAQLGLPDTGYGLVLAALEPRKRIDRIIEAWRILPDGLRRRYPLVIAGAAGWENEDLKNRITQAVSDGWAISLGYVDETLLPALYSGARLFAYPSMYEGFGMPPVEAMACGIPVAVANCSCLPEISGQAAVLIDPEDIEGTARLLAEALTDEAWRVLAAARGFKVAERLTWDRCVRETLEAYARA